MISTGIRTEALLPHFLTFTLILRLSFSLYSSLNRIHNCMHEKRFNASNTCVFFQDSRSKLTQGQSFLLSGQEQKLVKNSHISYPQNCIDFVYTNYKEKSEACQHMLIHGSVSSAIRSGCWARFTPSNE